jgi:hypothetical protein
VSRFIIVLCLLALLFVVLVPVAAAAPPTPQKWVDNAKKKVWGTNGSDGSAARGAGAAGRNGVNLPSGNSRVLGAGYKVVKRAMRNGSR